LHHCYSNPIKFNLGAVTDSTPKLPLMSLLRLGIPLLSVDFLAD
jgi:hypothetical protein